MANVNFNTTMELVGTYQVTVLGVQDKKLEIKDKLGNIKEIRDYKVVNFGFNSCFAQREFWLTLDNFAKLKNGTNIITIGYNLIDDKKRLVAINE